MERKKQGIDELLEDESVRKLVGALPEDELSLEWRSQLNERLLAIRPRVPAKWWITWRPVAGLALAGALVGTLILRAPQDAPSTPTAVGLDEAMIAAHRESVTRQEIGAAPVSSLRSDTASQPTYYDEVDLSTL